MTDVNTGQIIGDVKYISEDYGYAFVNITTEEFNKETNVVWDQTTLA